MTSWQTGWLAIVLGAIFLPSAAAEITEAEIAANRIARAKQIVEATDGHYLPVPAIEASRYRTALGWIGRIRGKEADSLRAEWRAAYLNSLEELVRICFYLGDYGEAIEYLAELLRPSLDPKNQFGLEWLNESEIDLNFHPFERARFEHLRAVVHMKLDNDSAYYARLFGTQGDHNRVRYGPISSHGYLFQLNGPIAETLTLRVSDFDYDDTPLGEVFEDFERRSEISIRLDSIDTSRPIGLKIKTAPMVEALDYICQLGHVGYYTEDDQLVIVELAAFSNSFATADFRLPPALIHHWLRETNTRSLSGFLVNLGTAPMRDYRFEPRTNLLTVRTRAKNTHQIQYLTAIIERFTDLWQEPYDPAAADLRPQIYGIAELPPKTQLQATIPFEIGYFHPADGPNENWFNLKPETPVDPFEDLDSIQPMRLLPAKEALEHCGFEFPPGASAIWEKSTGRLIVVHRPETLDQIETYFRDNGLYYIPRWLEPIGPLGGRIDW